MFKFFKEKKELRERVQKLIKENDRLYERLQNSNMNQNSLLDDLKRLNNYKPTFESMIQEALGFPIDFSSASKDKCLPPHFLDNLPEEERKNFIIEMETIYKSERFQSVLKYMINLFAISSFYKDDDKARRNGQIAAVAFRTFIIQMEDMHREFTTYHQKEEEFDEQAILPE